MLVSFVPLFILIAVIAGCIIAGITVFKKVKR